MVVTGTVSTADLDVAGLRRAVAGPVFLPGDDGYDAEVVSFNFNNPLEPAVAVGATSADDVRAAVRFAAGNDLPVAVRATGHQVAKDVHGAVLINTSRMDGIRIDADTRTARVEAGVRWQAAVDAAAKDKLAPMSGSSPTASCARSRRTASRTCSGRCAAARATWAW